MLPGGVRADRRTGQRADFRVGDANLRGSRHLADRIAPWPGGMVLCCRPLFDMPRAVAGLRWALLLAADASLDIQTTVRHKRRLAGGVRRRLATGAPTNEDVAAPRQLSAQPHARRLLVKGDPAAPLPGLPAPETPNQGLGQAQRRGQRNPFGSDARLAVSRHSGAGTRKQPPKAP